ncbi:class I adenylate-forming enzyme family protein [Castellaniella sp.]|uniref:class I adenylate-forming enzyme family protein n=1 Tax=Castellaniella sp. TaxID=1955812 RepID=UPI003A93EDF9
MMIESRESYAPRIEGGRFVVDPAINTVKSELHFGNQVVRCLARRPQRFDELLRTASRETPDREALKCQDESLDYRAFGDWADRIAHGLENAGIGVGDRVGVFLGNGLPFLIAMMGVVRRGAIAVPLSAKMSAAELAYVLNHCEAAALISETDLHSRMPSADEIPSVRKHWCVNSLDGRLGDLGEHFPGVTQPFPEIGEEDDTILLFYTSGTTGRPKGACITNLNIVHSALQYAYGIDLQTNQRGLLAIPGSHISGFMALFINILSSCGCTVILRRYDTTTVLRTLLEEHITFTVFVPAIYHLILMHPDFRPDRMGEWRTGIYGGGIMAPATVSRMSDLLPQLQLINAYGATETSSPVSIMPAWASRERPASIGLLVQCGEALIMDEAGVELPTGEIGELWIRGPMVVPRYWNDPAQTEANFKSGYWKTGDVVSMDAEGYLYIHDRKKDMINRGGYKIFSAEVENAALSIKGVMEAAAVVVPDDVMGERVCLCLRTEPGEGNEQHIRGELARLLADYKQPEFYIIGTEPLPRNANGKITKAPLVEAARQFVGQRQ